MALTACLCVHLLPSGWAIATTETSENTSQAAADAPPTGRRVVGPRALVLLLATAGGAGYAPVAPGTAGAALALLLFAPLAALGPVGYGAVTLALFAVGVPASSAAERIYGRRDDGRIVIDEVVGQLIALAPLLAASAPARHSPLLLLGAGFLLFRLFDIWKPGPVRLLERRVAGGLGVMLDDVAAGALGAGAMALLLLGLGGAGAAA